ncbi:MAG: transporter substrate-binding domain-containing protein, partial [Butyricicoccus sp.]
MKKKIALALAAMMMTGALTACGGSKDTPAASSGAASSDAAASQTASSDTLVMGTNAAFPPYEFVDDNNEIAGIDAEIAQAIADKLGMTLEIKDMAFDSLIPALQSDTVDIVLAGMTVTDERKEAVDFTESYATGIQVVIVPENSEIASIDDLEGKKIGVQTGTTGDIYCSSAPEDGGYGEDAVARYDNGALAVAALQNGQVDCVV